MKILYIAHERSAAQAAAHALRSIAPDVTLTWARSPGVALGWIQGNRDVRAVIVDAETQNRGCNVVLDQVRLLGTTIPVAVIAPDHLDGLLNALKPGLDAVVERARARCGLLEAQLRDVEDWRQEAQHRLANRQAEHDAALARTGRISTALQERLLELEAALRSADERHSAQAASLAELARRETELGAVAAEAAALRAAAEQRLVDSEHAHRQAGDRAAADLAAAAERRTLLQARLREEQTARVALEARLAVAETALQDAERSHAVDLAALIARLDDADSQHRAASVRSNRICTALQVRLLELETTLERADERHAADTATTERLAGRETELSGALAAANEARIAVEKELADARTAHHDVAQGLAADLAGAIARATALEDRLNQEIGARTSLEAQVAAAATDGERVEHQHAAERAELTTRLADLRTQYDASVARTASLERQVTSAEVALEQARDQWQSELAAASRHLALRETELTDALTVAGDARTAVERELADARAAHHDVAQRLAADVAVAIARATALEDRLNQEIGARTSLEAQVAAAATDREGVEHRHAAERAELTTRFADLQTQYDASVARTTALEQHVTGAAAALEQGRSQWQADLTAAAERQASRETELSGALAAANEARIAIEKELADARATHHDVEQRLAAAATLHEHAEQGHASEHAAWTIRLAELQTQHDAAVNLARSLEQQVTEATAALEQGRGQWQADLTAAAERLASREAELSGALAAAYEARTAVERELADARAAHHEAARRVAADLAARGARAAALGDRLNQEIAARTSLEAQVVAAVADREHAELQHATERLGLTTRLRDVQAQFDASVGRIGSLEQELAATTAALEQGRGQWQTELAAAAERLASREAELTDALTVAGDARTAVERELADARAAHHDAHQQFAADLAASTALSAALEARLGQEVAARVALEEQFGEERALTGSLQDSLLQIEESTRLTIEAGSRDNERLKRDADRLRRQLDAMRAHAAALRRDLEQLPVLQLRFDESQKENRRQFERAPYGLCECTPDGTITRVNHSLARLLGYRSSAELQRVDFVATVFECADDLRWLLERAVETGKPQSVETLLKTRDLGRLNVRLHASTTDRSVVIAVEDLTKLNAVEQRLREAHRLEAVGRVASEVAVTCDSLLRDVTRGGHQWLAGLESDTSLRNQGELLLGDVTRAAGFLRQFAVYGHKAIKSLEPVSVPRVLREMEPVLKRVLGNDISLTLPKPAALFEIDVDAETVQRIFVNVANYGRERMPHGGCVKIDLATTVVDQRFLAKHPEVRPGAHVLITITEFQGATRPALPIQMPLGRAAPPPQTGSPSDRPGMDLGPLVALISDLGGHLWMSAEPGGNLTLQIHIPKRTVDEEVEASAGGSRISRGRQFTRWFRH